MEETLPLLGTPHVKRKKKLAIIIVAIIACLIIPTVIILALLYEPIDSVAIVQKETIVLFGCDQPFTVVLEGQANGGREKFITYSWLFSDGITDNGPIINRTFPSGINQSSTTILPSIQLTVQHAFGHHFWQQSSKIANNTIDIVILGPKVKIIPNNDMITCQNNSIVIQQSLSVNDIIIESIPTCPYLPLQIEQVSQKGQITDIQRWNTPKVKDTFPYFNLDLQLTAATTSTKRTITATKPLFHMAFKSPIILWYQGASYLRVTPYFSFNPQCWAKHHRDIIVDDFALYCSGTIAVSLEVEIYVKSAINLANIKRNILSQFGDEIVIPAGIIDLPVGIYFEVDIIYSLLAGEMHKEGKFSISDTIQAEIGAEWSLDRGFSSISFFKNNAQVVNDWSVVMNFCGVSTSITLAPQIQFRIFNLYPRFSFGPNFALEAKMQGPVISECGSCIVSSTQVASLAELDYKMDGQITLDVDIDSKEWDFDSYSKQLWHKCGRSPQSLCESCPCDNYSDTYWVSWDNCCPYGGCDTSGLNYFNLKNACLCVNDYNTARGRCARNRSCADIPLCMSDADCPKNSACDFIHACNNTGGVCAVRCGK